jgi:hypothetical protein
MEDNANVHIGEILLLSIVIPITKVNFFSNIQMEHSHSIIKLNITQKRKK